MSHPEFEIRILRQHWIKDDGRFDEFDRCSHGEVNIRIGSEELSSTETGALSLSSAALFLMRTLDQDCGFQEYSNYLVPCCGHAIFSDEDGENLVVIPGCNHGLDWKVKHIENVVELETENGTTARLSFDKYKEAILAFVDDVEDFYGDPGKKSLMDDKDDDEAFARFWQEWYARKNRWA